MSLCLAPKLLCGCFIPILELSLSSTSPRGASAMLPASCQATMGRRYLKVVWHGHKRMWILLQDRG